MSKSPSLDIDLFSEAAISDPYPCYKSIRDLGAAVWLSNYDAWAISRFDDVRAALRADSILISGKGVAMNDFINDAPNRTTLSSDGDLHRQRRKVLIKPMMPAALKDVRDEVQAKSDLLVDNLMSKSSFDGITDFARYLPLSVVSFLVGLPEDGREQMLDWAGAIFNALGPLNQRAHDAGPGMMAMLTYADEIDPAKLEPQGWAAAVFKAAEAGKLDPEDARGLIIDYVAPSLDTTILGAGHMLYQLAKNPAEFDKVKADPTLIPAAVHESLRIGSPVRAFTRLAETDYNEGEVSIPAGDRVVILYGAANHDGRHYSDPETFSVERNPKDHVGFGHGVHRCAGGHLAQLELECLLDSMVRKVSRIEAGEPTPLLSNMLSGFAAFEASFA